MKILILTSKCGMGHFQCAKAICERMELGDLSSVLDSVEIVDIYEVKSEKRAKYFYKAYNLLVDKGNKLYNLSYKAIRKQTDNQMLLRLIDSMLVEDFDGLIQSRKPDVVISTYSFASELMADFNERTGSLIPLITWITDVNPHEGWVNPYTDHYIVADRVTKRALVTFGISEDRINIGGIPVSLSFSLPMEKREHSKKRILMVGGGLGLLPKKKSFYRKLSSEKDVELTVVTGKNRHLYHMLTKHFPHIRALGYVQNMNELMQEADLILTKAGGMTTFEAIQSEKPMIIFRPFLEQEIHNAKYVASMGMGYVLSSRVEGSKLDVPFIVSILKNELLLERMRSNVKRVKNSIDDQVLDYILMDRCVSL